MRLACVVALVLGGSALGAQAPGLLRASAGGTQIEVAIDSLTEGADTAIRVRLSDAATGTPLTSAALGAWLTPHAPDAGTPQGCRARIATFVGGGVFAAPEVEINASYVVGLNDDATITALSPTRSFGGTRMVGLVQLPAPGADWALTADTRRLFVAMPDASGVAVVDAFAWRILGVIGGVAGASRVAIQPDGGYVWVTGTKGVSVIDARTLQTIRSIDPGGAAGAVAFSDDSRTAFVTVPDRNHVAIVPIATLDVARVVDVEGRPEGIAFSAQSAAAWVVTRDGVAAGINAGGGIDGRRVRVEQGRHLIAIPRGMRHALVVNRDRRLLHVLDTAGPRVTKTAPLAREPAHVAFSDRMAYLQPADGGIMTLVPLEAVQLEGGALSMSEIPAGGLAGVARDTIAAPSIAPAASLGAMAIASAPDRAIQIYREGMAAPMGTLANDRRVPRAVMVVDRGLRETREPGLYESTLRLPSSGRHDLVLFARTPAVAQCFTIDVAPATKEAPVRAARVSVTSLAPDGDLVVRGRVTVRFRLASGDAAITGRDDVTVMVMLAPGRWHARVAARAEADGVYAADITPPAAGIYYAYAGSAGLGLAHTNPHYQVLEVRER